MSESVDVLAFGATLSYLVSEVAYQMADASVSSFEERGTGLNLQDLMLETSHCCQRSARVSSITVTGFGKLLDLVLSQEFGKFNQSFVWFSCLFRVFDPLVDFM